MTTQRNHNPRNPLAIPNHQSATRNPQSPSSPSAGRDRMRRKLVRAHEGLASYRCSIVGSRTTHPRHTPHPPAYYHRPMATPTKPQPKEPSCNPQSATRNPQSPICNPQSAIPNPQSPICNPQSAIPNLQSPINNLQPATRNPQSTIHNPQPAIPNLRLSHSRTLPRHIPHPPTSFPRRRESTRLFIWRVRHTMGAIITSSTGRFR